MERLAKSVCRITVISLLLSVIWHSSVLAAAMPKVVSLGRIAEKFSAPTKIDVDNSGALYVADARLNCIFKFDKYGRKVATFNPAKVTGGGLGVTADGAKIYVSSTQTVVAVDGASGAVLWHLGAGPGEFFDAAEIDVDDQGYVYVADNGTAEIKVYNGADGKFLYKFGGRGKTNGLFWMIRAIAIDPTRKEIYVLDPSSGTGAPRVQAFGLDGKFLRVATYTAFGTPYLAYPAGIAFDGLGRSYVAESFYSDVRVSNIPSGYLGKFGTEGAAVGQLLRPYDIVYEPLSKRLFIASDGARVEIFGVDGGENPVIANVAPGVPVPFAPANDQEVVSASPLLTWNNASDADNDVLTYNVKVFDAQGAVVASATRVASGATTSSVAVAAPLTENARYTWTVQADDGEELSAWSAPQSFVVNAVQEAPSAPALSAPLAEALLDGKALFGWSAASDPDPFDSVVAYRLQVSASSDFSAPLLSADLSGQEQVLGTLTNYDKLIDGQGYFWRVLAVDNHGLASEGAEVRAFVYDTAILKVTANLPGAKVYFGGNLAYSGRYVGEAPLELRDVAAGSVSVVVEHAGFEPWLGQATIAERANVTLYAEQQGAIVPADLKARPLSAGGAKIVVGADAVPTVVDYNNDGYLDLFVADNSGVVKYYAGIAGDQPAFDVATTFPLTLPANAVPLLVDWNNDGRKDLLVGTGAGNVLLYLNGGDDAAPAFAEASYVLVDGAPLAVGGNAAPVVFDVNGDGKKDLLVGSAAGSVYKFVNTGSDEAPVLNAGGELLGKLSANAVPFLADWNADGRKDVLLATDQHLYVCLQLVDGTFAPRSVLTVGDDLVGKKGKSTSGSGYLGDRLHLFAHNFDGKKGKDLIIGNAAGELRLAASFGKKPVAAYPGAVSAKLGQIAEVAADEAPALLAGIGEIEALVAGEKYGAARDATVTLGAAAPAGGALALVLDELAKILDIH